MAKIDELTDQIKMIDEKIELIKYQIAEIKDNMVFTRKEEDEFDKDYYSVRDAANILGVPKRVIYSLRAQDRLGCKQDDKWSSIWVTKEWIKKALKDPSMICIKGSNA